MASWQSFCSSARPVPRTTRSPSLPDLALRAAIACIAVCAVSACGRADTPVGDASNDPSEIAAADAPASAPPPAAELLCRPADQGFLRARLQGAIDAEIDWSAPATAQCLAAPRPSGDGLRLVYSGVTDRDGPLRVVIGVRLGEAERRAKNVPANVTVVREGAGVFFATQGDDKCALDEVTQEPIAGQAGRYLLVGRGYCTQPARAVGNVEATSVLVSRFDVEAVVEYPREQDDRR